MGITCKQATDYISRREEGKISMRQRLQLVRHLAVCSLCRLFSKQNKLLVSILNKAGQASEKKLETQEKEEIIREIENSSR